MDCRCEWSKDRNNIFIKHILQLLSISECEKSCKCFLCEIIKNINCKCSCGCLGIDLKNCSKCEKQICNDCREHENQCFKCCQLTYKIKDVRK
jgi:hypothetical protein